MDNRPEKQIKEQCPCCGYFTLSSKGDYDICPVCFWEDDPFQRRDAEDDEGANSVCLRKARENYVEFGACTEKMTLFVREPYDDEKENEKLIKN